MHVSPEDYVAFERRAEARHEYVDGQIVAMSGGSRRHSLAAAQLIRLLGNALSKRPCEVYTSDMRVKAGTRYTYPDVSVARGRSTFEDDKQDTLLNPIVLCEVLSDSTEAYDQQIESLHHYILVSQSAPRVECFLRQPSSVAKGDGHKWLLHVLGPGQTLILGDIECAIPIDEIFLKAFDRSQAE